MNFYLKHPEALARLLRDTDKLDVSTLCVVVKVMDRLCEQ